METQAAFFTTRCWWCLRKARVPLLPDHLYGSILLQTCDGKAFAEARLLDNPVFDSVCSILEASPDLRVRNTDPQAVLARLADPVNGQDLSARLYRCPNCNRKIARPSDLHPPAHFGTIPVAAWDRFLARSAHDRSEIIQAAIRNRR